MANRLKDLIASAGTLWGRLPYWLRFALRLGVFVAVLETIFFSFDKLKPLFQVATSPLGFLAAAAVVIVGGFLLSLFVSLRNEDPREIIRQADEFNSGQSIQRRKSLTLFLVGGSLACVALAWVVAYMADPGDGGRQFEAVAMVGGVLAILFFGLPAATYAVLWLVGIVLPPVHLRSRYRIKVAADRDKVWSARSAIERTPEYNESINRVERMRQSPGEVWSLTGGLGSRIFRADMQLRIVERTRNKRFVTDATTVGGDRESTHLEFRALADDRVEIICESDAQLRSPIIKALTRIAGIGHMARGGAETETRRYRILLGVDAELCDLEYDNGERALRPRSQAT